MKILIVDDNLDSLEMLKFYLEEQNHKVGTAHNGKIALEKLRAEKYGLIISDILMPVMDGFQLCRECKKDPKLKNICFIFYTATYIDNKDEELAYIIGAQGFIRKPLDPDQFMKLVVHFVKKWEHYEGPLEYKEFSEKEVLKLYNERLIAKLEKRNIELANEIEAHKKTIDELKIAKERAEESDKLKSAFLANISHEIRTPMNGIIGFINLLKDPANSKEEQTEYINIIEKSGKRLMNIINDIVEISKIEAGSSVIRNTEFEIHDIFLFLYKFFMPEAEKKGLKLSYACKGIANDTKIISDREKLYSILTNLIKNAIKYTDEGSIVFGCEHKGEFIEFFVKDTGIGIEKQFQESIFEKFVQANFSDIRVRNGVGLGLSISKAYVEMLGGKIWLESKTGKGTSFFFTLPINPVNIEQVISESSSHSIDNFSENYKKLKVLIVEDDNVSYEYIKLMLKRISILEPLHAKNGKEAVEMVEKFPDIDIVLLDIKMPIMDGYEAFEKMKKINPKLSILAQTAYAFNEDKDRILAMGCDCYIAKPYSIQAFMSAINEVAKKHLT